MVKVLKPVRYLCTSKNTKGSTDWTTKGTTNANPVNDIQTKISKPDRTKDNISLKPKMTRRMASGWMTVWRLDTGTKAIRKDAVKMVEATVQLGAISPRRKRRNANRGVERGLRGAKGNVWRREYHFHPVIHMNETTLSAFNDLCR